MNAKLFMHSTAKITLILLYLLGIAVIPTQARETESLNSIMKLAETFISNELDAKNFKEANISIKELDSRLKLEKCTTHLIPKLHYSATITGKITVAIHCKEPKPWTVHVPAEVTVYKTVLAAAHTLNKGHIITINDITPVAIKLNKINSFHFIKTDNLVGKVVKRPISGGKVIRPRYVEAARVVRRGENVTIIAVTESIRVSMKGKALADGTMGQLIQVRNLKTKRVVQGIVTKPGFVKVRM